MQSKFRIGDVIHWKPESMGFPNGTWGNQENGQPIPHGPLLVTAVNIHGLYVASISSPDDLVQPPTGIGGDKMAWWRGHFVHDNFLTAVKRAKNGNTRKKTQKG